MSATYLPIDSVDVFGPMVSRGDIVRAINAQLTDPATGLVFYIAERERRRGLVPRTLPVPLAPFYRGGLDFETWASDEIPTVITVVQPLGDPERHEHGIYEQTYDVRIGAILEHDTEAEAIDLADEYGICIATCVLQNPSLGGLAISTRLNGAPATVFHNPDRRVITRTVVMFRVYVQPILSENGGPWPPAEPGPAPDPYALPGDFPTVSTVNLTVTGQSPDGSQSSTVGPTTIDHS